MTQLQIGVALLVIIGLIGYGLRYRRQKSLPLEKGVIVLICVASVSFAVGVAFLDLPSLEFVIFALSHAKVIITYDNGHGILVPSDMSSTDWGNVVISNVLGLLALTAGAALAYINTIRRE